MKRIITGIALLAIGIALNAQSEESVLENARKNYQNAQGSQTTTTTTTTTTIVTTETTKTEADTKAAATKTDTASTEAESASTEGSEKSAENSSSEVKAPFTPMVIAFTPGLQVPLGDYRTSMAFGVIGIEISGLNGFMASGIFNIVENSINGFAGAGIMNLVGGKVNGFVASGVFNIVGSSVNGGMAAGVFNIAGDTVGFAMAAGVFNIGKNVNGVQAAGVFNISGSVNGFQSAGVFNLAQSVAGVQAAGVFNVAGKVQGLQIGLINIADSVDGLQLGLINISKDGIYNAQAWMEQDDYTYTGIQFGSKTFYTVFYAGEKNADWFENTNTLTLGTGFGVRMLRIGSAYLDFDAGKRWFVGNNAETILSTIVSLKNTEAAKKYVNDFSIPTFRLSAGVNVLFNLEAFAGITAMVGTPWLALPEEQRFASPMSVTMFDTTLDVYTKLFAGLKVRI